MAGFSVCVVLVVMLFSQWVVAERVFKKCIIIVKRSLMSYLLCCPNSSVPMKPEDIPSEETRPKNSHTIQHTKALEKYKCYRCVEVIACHLHCLQQQAHSAL